MAKISPSIENIKKLKQQPEEGEWYLLNYLINELPSEVEVYFQPFIDGDRPDIILMQKGVGVSIIEVKDWNLEYYTLSENNHWYVKSINQRIKSPFQQVFGYKNNLFNMHINGLLKEKIKNKNFYGCIKPFVYFHKANKSKINSFYSNVLDDIKEKIKELQSRRKNNQIQHHTYENQLDYLENKKKKIERDIRYYIIGNDSLNKIVLPEKGKLFSDNIYKEFCRYLNPPSHTLNEGRQIEYTKKQQNLIESKSEHKKIKGVAGAGKTMVLAKRAVNAHKRHNKQVLILTYNITLKRYIHDKISDVRENFNWGYFYITNYHQLITQFLNNLGIDIDIPDEIENKSEYLDKYYYSNQKLFDSYIEELSNSSKFEKFESIFIDEIQDYKSEWVKIIRKHFLVDNGEFVVFGDEKQNIYDRELDETKSPNLRIQGLGRWEKINTSMRHSSENNRILNLAKKFQSNFFINKYEIDEYENKNKNESSLSLDIYKMALYSDNNYGIVETIFSTIRDYDIHQNDVTILSSNVHMLKDIDFIIRNTFNFKTLTTFETKEMYESNSITEDMEKIRKNKKIAFNLNNGMLKISTIHSFKGYESPTVFLIIDEKDTPEIIYAGLTRSKYNIMIFHKKNSIYSDFFDKELENSLINR